MQSPQGLSPKPKPLKALGYEAMENDQTTSTPDKQTTSTEQSPVVISAVEEDCIAYISTYQVRAPQSKAGEADEGGALRLCGHTTGTKHSTTSHCHKNLGT